MLTARQPTFCFHIGTINQDSISSHHSLRDTDILMTHAPSSLFLPSFVLKLLSPPLATGVGESS
jgi:hypothetical protein